jgi:thimet oligopeptidase
MSNAFSCGHVIVLALLITTVAAQEMPKSQPPLWSAKPDVVAFEKMENDRLAAAQRAIDQILAVHSSRTIENTLVPYDEAFEQIDGAIHISDLIQVVHPDAAFRDHATALNTKASNAQTALSLNWEVYRALASLDLSQADAATRYYVQRQLLEFRLAGVDKDDATRTKLKKLQQQLTEDQSTFDRNIRDDQRNVEVADASELDGLPQDFIDDHKLSANGKIRITVDEPNSFIVLKFANNEGLRRRFWEAFWSARAYPKNREVLQNMLRSRSEIATLLGYSSWADYNAADKMIGNGSNIAKFIDELDAALRPVAQQELNMLLAERRKTYPQTAEIADYDYDHLSELVRRSQYDFDSQSVRPYLPYNQVKKGILDTAATLFHVSFRQELNVPAWDPSVETWDVIDNGKAIGRFYLDMHPRPGKFVGAQEHTVLDGIRGRQLPEAALICNFPEPTATDPGLMDYDQVSGTFFHEFGHLMHEILGGHQQWAGISGISMEQDFQEAPSQMLEEWMHSPQVLTSFARHYKTGEAIPGDLVARMNRASAFGRANYVANVNAYAAISYDLHKGRPEETDPDVISLHNLRHYTLLVAVPSAAHVYASFPQLCVAMYSAAAYQYMWDLVIAEDFFQQFDQHNLLAGDTPMRYRRTVLEPGGSMSANDLVKNFLGRPQNMKAFQKWMGEEFDSAPQSKSASGTLREKATGEP